MDNTDQVDIEKSSSPTIPVSTTPSSILNDSVVSEEEGINNNNTVYKYTSLRDVFMACPSHYSSNLEYYYYGGGIGGGGGDFDPTSIAIRNQLVKHAASAYVQSATLIASQNQNWLARLWDRVRPTANSGWVRRWRAFVWYPLRACFRPVYYSLEYIVENAFNSVIRV